MEQVIGGGRKASLRLSGGHKAKLQEIAVASAAQCAPEEQLGSLAT